MSVLRRWLDDDRDKEGVRREARDANAKEAAGMRRAAQYNGAQNDSFTAGGITPEDPAKVCLFPRILV